MFAKLSGARKLNLKLKLIIYLNGVVKEFTEKVLHASIVPQVMSFSFVHFHKACSSSEERDMGYVSYWHDDRFHDLCHPVGLL